MPTILNDKIKQEKLQDPRWKLRLSVILVRYRKGKVKISDHPYTKALQAGDQKLYEQAVQGSDKQRVKASSKWSNFLSLRKNMKTQGYKVDKEPIILKWDDGQWYCSHGRHRICLLWDLYGPNTLLGVTQAKRVAYVWKVFPRPLPPAAAAPYAPSSVILPTTREIKVNASNLVPTKRKESEKGDKNADKNDKNRAKRKDLLRSLSL